MSAALRFEDGVTVSSEEYAAIRTDTATICNAILARLPKPERARWGKRVDESRTITWYKSFYWTELRLAVAKLEKMHFVLRLCGGNWKAEHMIMNHLNSNNTTAARRVDGGLQSGRKVGKTRRTQARSPSQRHSRSCSPASPGLECQSQVRKLAV